jgi:hypothetical protein
VYNDNSKYMASRLYSSTNTGGNLLGVDRKTTSYLLSNQDMAVGPVTNNSLYLAANNTKVATFTDTAITLSKPLKYVGTNYLITANTSDGADTSIIEIGGGGAIASSRGAYISLAGEDNSSTPGDLFIAAGASGDINMSAGGVNVASFSSTAATITVPLYLPSTGATASGLDFYATTTLTWSWTPNGTGSTASSTGNAYITRIGNLVTITIPTLNNAVPAGTTISLRGPQVPTWARPTTAVTGVSGGVHYVYNNATWEYTGAIEFVTDRLYLYRTQTSTSYTNGANAGGARTTISYIVD